MLKFLSKKRSLAEQRLFQNGNQAFFQALHEKEKTADSVYFPAFDRIFLLLKHFYTSGLRGDILEFGVYFGYSAKVIADRIERFNIKETRLHLFDSFEGLPEAVGEDQNLYEVKNGNWGKGNLDTPIGIEELIEKKLGVQLGQNRVSVIKGFFEKTLEPQLEKIDKALMIHLDCDLYSSSKYVLETLFNQKRIQDGTILICDDWMTSLGSPRLGQRKAVADVLDNNPGWELEPYLNYGLGSQVFVIHAT